MTDLLNCPFCGSGIDNSHPRPFPTFHNGVRWWVARCGNPDCAAEIEAGSVKECTERWNRRIDATAAPVVVGEDIAREVIEAVKPFLDEPNPNLGGGYLVQVLVQASVIRRLKAAIADLTAMVAPLGPKAPNGSGNS